MRKFSDRDVVRLHEYLQNRHSFYASCSEKQLDAAFDEDTDSDFAASAFKQGQFNAGIACGFQLVLDFIDGWLGEGEDL